MLTKEQEDKIKLLAEKLLTCKEIANEVGCSKHAVNRVSKRLGIAIITPVQKNRINARRLSKEGYDVATIAKKMDMTFSGAWQLLNRLGLTLKCRKLKKRKIIKLPKTEEIGRAHV